VTSTSQNEDLRAAWFGKVSPNWQLARAKNAFQVVSKKVGQRSSEYDLLSLTLRGIIPRDIESGKGKFPESFDTYQEVKESDIVFCLFDIDETPRTVGLSSIDGMITGAYTVVRCTKYAEPRFVTYFYRSIDERKGLRPFYTGLRKVVRTETFLNAAFPLPDLPTQRAIADFLDRETARIDSLIEKKQRLVELLGEKYETETIRLMTRGVRGDESEFVSSIYNWAPDVPAHWTQTPLRQLLRLTSGSVGEKSGDFVLLSLTKRGVIPRDIESGKGKFPSDFSAYQVVKPHQLVLCLFDMDETPRTVGLSREHGMVTGAYTVADINADRVDGDFIYFHLLYLDNNKRLRPFYTGLRKVVRPQTFLNIRIPLPPMDEQKQIVQELRHWERRSKDISDKTNASIDRLKEYRSSLITSAVTGQIDVSTYARSGTTDRQLDAIQSEVQA
jgi:type I restriction enzyme, S subunit